VSEEVVVVVSGGDPPASGSALAVPPGAPIIAADSGLEHALALGLEVAVAVGDFDSASSEAVAIAEAAGVRIERHPTEKDATDLELALDAAMRMNPRRIVRIILPIASIAGFGMLFSAATGTGGFGGILIPLFCFIACYGFIMPNTTALAMAPYGAMAGSASALLGTLQFVMGATAGALVGALGNGTAVPFAAVMAGCGLGALATYRTLPQVSEQLSELAS